MQYMSHYMSPIGDLLLIADEVGLNEIWFDGGAKYEGPCTMVSKDEESLPHLDDTKRWLDIYFSGQEPDFMPELHIIHGSEFQRAVWDILRMIPYGETTTYGEIAKTIAKQRGIRRMSAQAIGGAVGRNDIPIIIPCHRVIGSDGNLTGYAGGLDKKIALLRTEGFEMPSAYKIR